MNIMCKGSKCVMCSWKCSTFRWCVVTHFSHSHCALVTMYVCVTVCFSPLWYSIASNVSSSEQFPNALPGSDSSLCCHWVRCVGVRFSPCYGRTCNQVRFVAEVSLSIRRFGYRRATFSGRIGKYWFVLQNFRCLWVCRMSGVLIFETCRRVSHLSSSSEALHSPRNVV